MATRSYTRQQLGMDIDGEKYYLPFETSVTEDEIMEKTVELFSNADIYERKLYTDLVKKPAVFINQYHKIEMQCLYEGNDGYYSFAVVLEVFRLNDEKHVHDKSWMIAMMIEQDKGALLEELIELKTIPKMHAALRLVKYSCLR